MEQNDIHTVQSEIVCKLTHFKHLLIFFLSILERKYKSFPTFVFRATVIFSSEENTALFSQDLEKITSLFQKKEEIECPNA